MYYANDRKQFSLTQEYTLLPLELQAKQLTLFDGNQSVTGGKFVLNAFRIHDSFFDFYQTWRFPDSFLASCYQNASSLFFNHSRSSYLIAGLDLPLSKVAESKGLIMFNIFG